MTRIMILLTIMTVSMLQADRSKVEQVLNSYMNAWNEHNISKIESHYSPNVVWYDLPSDSTTKGKKKVSTAITTAFMGYVPDMFWVKSGDVFVSDNTITYEWSYGGTFNGSWGDIKVINKKFSIKGISTTSIDEKGKIISQKDYYDMYTFQKQLGVLKP